MFMRANGVPAAAAACPCCPPCAVCSFQQHARHLHWGAEPLRTCLPTPQLSLRPLRAHVPAQIVPWLSYSVPGVTNLLVLTATTGMALYCYGFCVLSNPGW